MAADVPLVDSSFLNVLMKQRKKNGGYVSTELGKPLLKWIIS